MNWYKGMPPVDFSSRHEVLIEDWDGILTPMDVPYFKATPMAEGVWQIMSDGDFIYLLEGDEDTLLIDTGYGCGDLRKFCETLTKKPVWRVANTHAHFDHTANNYLFDKAYMSQEAVEQRTIPNPSFGNIEFPRDYPVEVIDDGYVFHLGNLDIEVYKFSDHSPGSLAFLDKKHRLFISGDEIVGENYRVRYSLQHSYEMMKKFQSLKPYYDKFLTGPGIWDASLIDEYVEAMEQLMKDPSQGEPMLPDFGQTPVPDGKHRVVYHRRLARSCDMGRHPDPDFAYKREFVYKGRRIEYWMNKL